MLFLTIEFYESLEFLAEVTFNQYCYWLSLCNIVMLLILVLAQKTSH